jgi:hypothetical protein
MSWRIRCPLSSSRRCWVPLRTGTASGWSDTVVATLGGPFTPPEVMEAGRKAIDEPRSTSATSLRRGAQSRRKTH